MALKEKCVECGKMESLGRKVCESKIIQIKEEQDSFLARHVAKPSAIIMIVGVLLMFVLPFIVMRPADKMANLGASSYWIRLCLSVAPGVGIMIGSFLFDEIARPKAKRKFFQLRPDYAELLKKEEGNK